MKKSLLHFIIQLFTASALCAASSVNYQNETPACPLAEYEQYLIQHVQQSIANADRGISQLSKEALSLEGLSSKKVRHLLNNLCAMPGANYLEIGTFKGSTWIAALYNNHLTISSAIAIENWSQFAGPRDQFIKNCELFLKNAKYQIIEQDCFHTDLNLFSNPINLYFYDGDHTALAQEKAFTYFDEIFDHTFIAIIDDWNHIEVPKGTYAAFKQLHYDILFEVTLPARWNGDLDNWWNGIHVVVIRKALSE